MSVIAESNKAILWDVLKGLVTENNLQVTDIDGFKVFFENKCKYYHSKRFDYNGLNEVNKEIVGECFTFLRKASNENKLIMFREYEQFGNKNVIKTMNISQRYEEHENNFKKMIKKKRPDDVDFTEEADQPIKNMGNMLSQTMEQRENELFNITSHYNQGDSIKWLNSGGVPKLKIHNDDYTENDSGQVFLSVQEIDKKENKTAKKEKPRKKVKFESDLKKEIHSSKSTLEREREMNAYFENMNNTINKQNKTAQESYVNKRNIIKEIDRREEIKPKKDDIDLNSIFNNMKVKTKDSDIIAAKTQNDPIDVNVRIDKLEKYMSDIILNQLKIMEMLSKNNITIPKINISTENNIETQNNIETENNIQKKNNIEKEKESIKQQVEKLIENEQNEHKEQTNEFGPIKYTLEAI